MLMIVPATLREANEYVKCYHRTHAELLAARFSLATAERETGLVRGVAIVGLPLARMLSDGYTLEVRRCCSDGARNACSILYGACWRTARAMGYRRLITYTLPAEGGASLRAVGWRPTQGCGGGSWNTPGRPREETPEHLLVQKTRWEITVERDPAPFPSPHFPSVPQPKEALGTTLWEDEYHPLATIE